jgi:hypothetical protein
MIVCLITLTISFRREVRAVTVRFLVSSGFYDWYLQAAQYMRNPVEHPEEIPRGAKVNYEIYNP